MELFKKYDLPLKAATPSTWVQGPLSDFDAFLQDHAACERKASALAMSMIAKYGDRGALIEPMISLAREELDHFRDVYRIINKRGLKLSNVDVKDEYVNKILKQLRHGRNERFLDRLVCSAIIEARGFERFHLIACALEDEELKKFYASLAESEAGHYMIFIRVARQYFTQSEITEAVERVSHIEAAAMLSSPMQATLH